MTHPRRGLRAAETRPRTTLLERVIVGLAAMLVTLSLVGVYLLVTE